MSLPVFWVMEENRDSQTSVSLSRRLHIHPRSVIEPVQVPSVVCVHIISMCALAGGFFTISATCEVQTLHLVAFKKTSVYKLCPLKGVDEWSFKNSDKRILYL